MVMLVTIRVEQLYVTLQVSQHRLYGQATAATMGPMPPILTRMSRYLCVRARVRMQRRRAPPSLARREGRLMVRGDCHERNKTKVTPKSTVTEETPDIMFF